MFYRLLYMMLCSAVLFGLGVYIGRELGRTEHIRESLAQDRKTNGRKPARIIEGRVVASQRG